jgi:hypothetical protein
MHRLNGAARRAVVSRRGEHAGAEESLATRIRAKDTDVADIWRCLEIALADGLGPADLAGGIRAESAAVIRALFGRRHGPGMIALNGVGAHIIPQF